MEENKSVKVNLETFNKAVKIFEHKKEDGRVIMVVSYLDAVEYILKLHHKIFNAGDFISDDLED